jgi:hypothetical protein
MRLSKTASSRLRKGVCILDSDCFEYQFSVSCKHSLSSLHGFGMSHPRNNFVDVLFHSERRRAAELKTSHAYKTHSCKIDVRDLVENDLDVFTDLEHHQRVARYLNFY